MPAFHNILQTQTYLQPLQKSGNTSEEHAPFSSEATHKPKTFTEVFHVPPFYIKQDQAYFFFCYPCLLHSRPRTYRRGELTEDIINSITHTTRLTSHMYYMCTAERHLLLPKLLQLKIRHKRSRRH